MRWLAASLLVLAACSPQDMADKVARRSAKSVVMPVVAQYMPSGQADAAANCVIDNASAGEISTLARDIGTRAGTTTVQTVVAVATRPSTVQCLMTQGIPPLDGDHVLMRWLVPILLLTACGPIPLEDAERACLRRAELAERPRGHIAIGAGSGGRTYTDLEVSASTDYFMGRDPSAVYDACVYQKSGGEVPSRPLYDRPDWRG